MTNFSFENYHLDTLKGVISHEGDVLEIQPQVYCILELLITRHGEVVSRDEIISYVWGGRVVSNNVIDNRILGARVAIGDTGKAQRYIKTYPNRGYKFVGNVLSSHQSSPLAESHECNANGRQDLELAEPVTSKRPFFRTRSLATYLAGGAFIGLLGLYIVSQTLKPSPLEASANIGADRANAVYDLGSSDESQALPRVAILPFETIGETSLYGFLPDVLESEFNQTVSAIKGLTVVSLVPDPNLKNEFMNYQTLKEEFELDYAIASKVSSYGDYFKLNVSLIRLEDSSVLSNGTYDLNLLNEDGLEALIAEIASKVTLNTANKLNLSVEDLPTSWNAYDFYAKIEEAEAITEPADYESMKKGAQLLREAIQDEPNYIPAYAKLILYLSWQAHFVVGDYAALHKEQAELAIKMQEISPGAPETLLMNSALGTITKSGVGKSSLGELVETDPMSVIDYILKKDPDNFLAKLMMADMSVFETDQAETVKLYENALRLSPTHPWALPDYSWALFCNENFREANEVLNRTIKWHPNHRTGLLAQLLQAQALGEYQEALSIAKRLLEQGVISHSETAPVIALFVDLGKPELALPHVRFPSDRAYIHAMMGNKEAAIRESRIIENFSTSIRARMIVQEDYMPESYSVDRTYARVGQADDMTKANMCRLDYLIRDTYILKQIESDKFQSFLPLLTNYFEGRDVETLKTRQEYTSLMGLHVLQGDSDKALEVMDIAMDCGFIFIGSFNEPFLRELTAHPEFSQRLDRMKVSANKLLEAFYN